MAAHVAGQTRRNNALAEAPNTIVLFKLIIVNARENRLKGRLVHLLKDGQIALRRSRMTVIANCDLDVRDDMFGARGSIVIENDAGEEFHDTLASSNRRNIFDCELRPYEQLGAILNASLIERRCV